MKTAITELKFSPTQKQLDFVQHWMIEFVTATEALVEFTGGTAMTAEAMAAKVNELRDTVRAGRDGVVQWADALMLFKAASDWSSARLAAELQRSSQ